MDTPLKLLKGSDFMFLCLVNCINEAIDNREIPKTYTVIHIYIYLIQFLYNKSKDPTDKKTKNQLALHLCYQEFLRGYFTNKLTVT